MFAQIIKTLYVREKEEVIFLNENTKKIYEFVQYKKKKNPQT